MTFRQCPECGHEDFDPDEDGSGDFYTDHAQWREEFTCPECGCQFRAIQRFVPTEVTYKIWQHGTGYEVSE